MDLQFHFEFMMILSFSSPSASPPISLTIPKQQYIKRNRNKSQIFLMKTSVSYVGMEFSKTNQSS